MVEICTERLRRKPTQSSRKENMGQEFIKRYGYRIIIKNHLKWEVTKKMTVHEYKMNNKLGRVTKGK